MQTNWKMVTHIFNQYRSQCMIPPCLKSSTIIPVPKKSTTNCLNDFIICFEKLVRSHITSCVPTTFDAHQFARRAIIPTRPVTTLSDLGFSQQICLWIKNLLTDHSQRVRVGPHLSLALTTPLVKKAQQRLHFLR